MTTITPAELATKVGEKIGTSEWILVDQEMINKFADATGDHQFIHVNEEMAKMTPFGGTIAHGFLTLSLTAALQPSNAIVLQGIKMGINYGCDKLRFLQPVRVGKRVRVRGKLLGIEDKGGGRYLLRNETTVEIEGEEKPALIAEWLSMQAT